MFVCSGCFGISRLYPIYTLASSLLFRQLDRYGFGRNKERTDHLRCCSLRFLEHMPIGVGCYRNLGVSQCLFNHREMHALGDEKRSARVSEIVKADALGW